MAQLHHVPQPSAADMVLIHAVSFLALQISHDRATDDALACLSEALPRVTMSNPTVDEFATIAREVLADGALSTGAHLRAARAAARFSRARMAAAHTAMTSTAMIRNTKT